MLLYNPNYIFNNGFLLSIIISFFILFYTETNKISFVKLSILSFLSSFPIIVNMYYEVNILSFLNNIILIPLITSLVFPFTFICLFIPKISIILKIR